MAKQGRIEDLSSRQFIRYCREVAKNLGQAEDFHAANAMAANNWNLHLTHEGASLVGSELGSRPQRKAKVSILKVRINEINTRQKEALAARASKLARQQKLDFEQACQKVCEDTTFELNGGRVVKVELDKQAISELDGRATLQDCDWQQSIAESRHFIASANIFD